MTMPLLPVAKPWMDEREAAAARRVILSGWVTQGPEVAAFEREFATAVGSAHAVAVSSCTTALHASLLAAGVRPGDEVIVPSHSFIATTNAVGYCGATPVFVDIDPGTFNLDPSLVEPLITPRTRAILAVHQLGMPCDLAAVISLARARGLKVVEDAACAIGSEIRWNGDWQRIGRPHGDVACFSFHPRKLVTTGDGGMATTDDADVDRRLRLLRQHGMDVPDTVRHASREVIVESYPVVGFNFRMTDIQAAIGREQLQRLPAMIARRRQFARRYAERLAAVEHVVAPHEPAWARSNWQSYCVRVDGADQRQVMQRMLDAGVSTRRGAMNAHQEAAWPHDRFTCGVPHATCGCAEGVCARLRNSERALATGIVLPLFHQMTDDDQDRVIVALTDAVRR